MEIKCFALGSFAANCYLVKTKDVAAVIDPFECDERIEQFFKENSSLERLILLTHCHFDHILGASALRERYGAKIAIGEYDAEGLSDASINLTGVIGIKPNPFTADILLKDQEVLKIGETEIEVIHTPGHTAGSVCYRLKDVLFSGDTLFEQSIGRTDFPTGNYSQMKQSLEKLKALSDVDLKILPGHGNATTIKKEIESNPYM